MATAASTNAAILQVKGAKLNPNASTVPRSWTKQVPRIPLPNSVRLKAVSSISAYTTAMMEVVDRAMPASQAARASHPSPQWTTAALPKNGARNPSAPTTESSRTSRRITSGSSSAPAKKVSSTVPAEARKRSHSSSAPTSSPPWNAPATAPAATPMQISTSAMGIFR